MSGLLNRVEVDIARKTYPARNGGAALTALDGLRFAVAEGELACIVGPSGCGKTTLLNIVSGLDADYDGSALVAGRPPGDEAAGIGYMFQSARLMPWLTVRENLELVVAAGDAGHRADKLLRDMELERFAGAWPADLSGGMRRRVALARAFMIEPTLLLLDEPFLSLDAPVANRLRLLLLDIRRSRPTTVIFVTHDLREALFLADRILFLSPTPGRVVLDLPVDLARPREPDGAAIEALRLDLLKKYPQILAGLAAATGEPA